VLFNHIISGISSWSKLFQEREVWAPLAEVIYRQNDIPFAELEQLTPGTNAVFKIQNTVLKIFAPQEADISTVSDYYAELLGLQTAQELNLAAPRLLAQGEIEDRYHFNYIVMEYVAGEELGGVLPLISFGEQEKALQQVSDMVKKLHRRESTTSIARGTTHALSRYISSYEEVVWRALDNPRWQAFTMPVQQEVRKEIYHSFVATTTSDLVYIHGDMTGENLLRDASGKIYLIDFADGCIAPPGYEYPAIVCELLDLNPDLVQRFYRYSCPGNSVDELWRYILLHDFGADYLRKIAARVLEKQLEEVANLEELRQGLARHLGRNWE